MFCTHEQFDGMRMPHSSAVVRPGTIANQPTSLLSKSYWAGNGSRGGSM